MPTDLIEELERLAAEATPPERWTVDRATVRIELEEWYSAAAYAGSEANAALIVAAINALPRLLAVWRAAEPACIAMEHAVSWIGDEEPLPAPAVDCINALAALRSALSPMEQKEQTK